MLELSQLYGVLNGPPKSSVEVGRLPLVVSLYLGAKLDPVYLSGDSLRHILQKHQGSMALEDYFLEMLCLPSMVSKALWIGERDDGSACMSYLDPSSGKRFIAAVKVAAHGYETYLTTFHMARFRQTRSLLKRGGVLQKHK